MENKLNYPQKEIESKIPKKIFIHVLKDIFSKSDFFDKLYDKIFDRFAQIEFSHTRTYEGSGLGLSICKGLVDLLGGKIWFDSQLNKGTTFYFTIPI